MSALAVRELTPSGRGAVAVLELRGAGALAAAARLAPRAQRTPGSLSLAALVVAGVELDRALVVVRDERCVELHLHGSPSVVAEVLRQLAPEQSPVAALELEEQALDLLGAAPCEAAARMLLDQAQGALRREIERLLTLGSQQAGAGLEQLLETARVARFALQPARVLLCGPVNAGKSTLFNALHGSDRVLVSDEAGTTRDVIAERVQLGGWPIDLWDTPGHRAGQAARTQGLELERAGLLLAEELADSADVLLWLVAVDQEAVSPPAAQDARWIVLASCGDRPPANPERSQRAAISALRDPQGAAHALAQRLCAHLGLPPDPWTPGRAVPFAAWQRELLESALHASPARRRADLTQLLAPRSTPDCGERVAADLPVR